MYASCTDMRGFWRSRSPSGGHMTGLQLPHHISLGSCFKCLGAVIGPDC